MVTITQPDLEVDVRCRARNGTACSFTVNGRVAQEIPSTRSNQVVTDEPDTI